METLESRVSRLEYYIKLLSGTSEQEAKPFIDLVVRNQLTKKEVEEILILCEDTKTNILSKSGRPNRLCSASYTICWYAEL